MSLVDFHHLNAVLFAVFILECLNLKWSAFHFFYVIFNGQTKSSEQPGASEDRIESVVKCWRYAYIPLQWEVLLGLRERISYGL